MSSCSPRVRPVGTRSRRRGTGSKPAAARSSRAYASGSPSTAPPCSATWSVRSASSPSVSSSRSSSDRSARESRTRDTKAATSGRTGRAVVFMRWLRGVVGGGTVEEPVEGGGEGVPVVALARELVTADGRDAVVLAVRAALGRHDVRRQCAGGVQAAQRAVDRRVADLRQPAVPQPAHDVVAVAVLAPDHGEHREVEDSLEELGLIHGPHTTTQSALVRVTNERLGVSHR